MRLVSPSLLLLGLVALAGTVCRAGAPSPAVSTSGPRAGVSRFLWADMFYGSDDYFGDDRDLAYADSVKPSTASGASSAQQMVQAPGAATSQGARPASTSASSRPARPGDLDDGDDDDDEDNGGGDDEEPPPEDPPPDDGGCPT